MGQKTYTDIAAMLLKAIRPYCRKLGISLRNWTICACPRKYPEMQKRSFKGEDIEVFNFAIALAKGHSMPERELEALTLKINVSLKREIEKSEENIDAIVTGCIIHDEGMRPVLIIQVVAGDSDGKHVKTMLKKNEEEPEEEVSIWVAMKRPFQVMMETPRSEQEKKDDKKLVILLCSGICTMALIVVFREQIREFIIWAAMFVAGVGGLILWLVEKKNPPTPLHDQPTTDRIAEIMTEVLTTLHAEIGIKKPYDAYSVYQAPTYQDGRWVYHAKAAHAEAVQLDDDSIAEYMASINGRAAAIGAPIMVTAIHPRGKNFVYDVVVTGNVICYETPNASAKDRDF
jgi:hypothetical protein